MGHPRRRARAGPAVGAKAANALKVFLMAHDSPSFGRYFLYANSGPLVAKTLTGTPRRTDESGVSRAFACGPPIHDLAQRSAVVFWPSSAVFCVI